MDVPISVALIHGLDVTGDGIAEVAEQPADDLWQDGRTGPGGSAEDSPPEPE